MESQHPVETEGDMHLARETIIAADVGRNVEERLFMERAIGVRCPTMLIAVQNVQAFHRTPSDSATDIRPGFVQSPATIG